MIDKNNLNKGHWYRIWYKMNGITFVYTFSFTEKTDDGLLVFDNEDQTDGLIADPDDIIKISQTRKKR